MSKTYKDVVSLFDTSKTKKRRGEASARFKSERKRKDDDKLFKREVKFVSWLERTSQDD
jgi:hypothetical protein